MFGSRFSGEDADSGLEGGRAVPLMEDGVLEVGGEESGCEGWPAAPGPPGLTMADEEALDGLLAEAERASWPPGEGCDLAGDTSPRSGLNSWLAWLFLIR